MMLKKQMEEGKEEEQKKRGREGGGGRRGRGREQTEKSSRSENTKPAVTRANTSPLPRIPGDTGGDAAYSIVFI